MIPLGDGLASSQCTGSIIPGRRLHDYVGYRGLRLARNCIIGTCNIVSKAARGKNPDFFSMCHKNPLITTLLLSTRQGGFGCGPRGLGMEKVKGVYVFPYQRTEDDDDWVADDISHTTGPTLLGRVDLLTSWLSLSCRLKIDFSFDFEWWQNTCVDQPMMIEPLGHTHEKRACRNAKAASNSHIGQIILPLATPECWLRQLSEEKKTVPESSHYHWPAFKDLMDIGSTRLENIALLGNYVHLVLLRW